MQTTEGTYPTTGVPTGTVLLRHVGGTAWVTGTLHNGWVTLSFVAGNPGTYQMRAEYSGDVNYQPGNSPTVNLVITS